MRIHEIYRSIQGESSYAGLPCTFIRTTGCDLRCSWCDTEQAFYGGEEMSLDAIMAFVEELAAPMVELTGGEPLLQKELPELAERLLAKGYRVLCETGGHRDISVLPEGAIKIMDLKCPGSGESEKNLLSNFAHLNKQDEVKFVIADRADFDWAKAFVADHKLSEVVDTLLFSPVHGACDGAELVGWMEELNFPARLNLQLHKVLWSPDATGV